MTSHHDRPPAVRRPRPEGDRRPEQPVADTETPALSVEVDELRRALAEAEDRYLRLAADFDNFKRRKGQELIDSSRYASEDAVKGLLPVLDNLRRAVEHAPEAGAEDFFVNGLELVVREFETALERLGVTKIPAAGEPFDPAVHNAIGGEESADVDSDIVSQELVPGYRLHDRLIRPAMVRVAHPRSASSAG
jgi:molecular chaperone GrpE